jgi:hypothetical protein
MAMKRTALALIPVLALLFSAIAGAYLVELAVANPIYEERRTDPPIVLIYSPANGSRVNVVMLNFTVAKPESWVGTSGYLGYAQQLQSVSYEADGKSNGSVVVNSNLSSPFNYVAYLSNLTDGVHNLIVHAYATGFVIETHGLWDYYVPINSSSAVYFTLDTTPTSVSVLSVKNETHDKSEVPLEFTTNEPTSQITYSLDGQENVTIAGNTTLTGLSYGVHNVTVYAWDAAGNIGSSETITFTTAKPQTFPATWATAAIVVIVVVGLLVYFKKRKH